MKPIPNYENYKITSDGVVFSCGKSECGNLENSDKMRIIAPFNTKNGYKRISLYKNGVMKNHYVHRLVAAAYLGESALQVNHINGNKQDNRVENLEYVTGRQNVVLSLDKTKTSSRYIGVIKTKYGYVARAHINGVREYLCFSKSEEVAAEKYKKRISYLS
jgi:hypothetical protein